MVLEPIIVLSKGGKVIIIPFAITAETKVE